MFVKKSTYKKALDEIKTLEKSLEQANDLKSVLCKLTDKSCSYGETISVLSGSFTNSEIVLPNDVARYVDDYYGGKVIKQEANKVVALNDEGEATYHLTKRPNTKGYKFRLELPKKAQQHS